MIISILANNVVYLLFILALLAAAILFWRLRVKTTSQENTTDFIVFTSKDYKAYEKSINRVLHNAPLSFKPEEGSKTASVDFYRQTISTGQELMKGDGFSIGVMEVQ